MEAAQLVRLGYYYFHGCAAASMTTTPGARQKLYVSGSVFANNTGHLLAVRPDDRSSLTPDFLQCDE